MLHFFPEPYDDEIYYSIITRYFYYSGSTSFFNTRSSLFGGIAACPIYLPKHLNTLTRTLPNECQLDNDYFIYNTSIFPLYVPFISTSKKKDIEETMSGSKGSPYIKLGLTTNNEKEYLALYYCPICLTQDIKKYGEPYFHRTHQAPGVIVCHMHGCLLEKYPCMSGDLQRGNLIKADEHKMVSVPRSITDSILDKELFDLSKAVNLLLVSNLKDFNIDFTQQLYRNKLRELYNLSLQADIYPPKYYNK